MKILFIVESPTKANTIRKLLTEVDPGNEYIVKATMGHVRDLEKKTLAVDVENGSFNCHFAIMDKKKQVITQLKQEAKECDMIYLASDMDREGESIAWHLVDVMKSSLPFKRITFNEITEEGIAAGLNNLHDINFNIVNAQIARRVIDRIVGFKMTPLLWKAFGISKLSSGRVQTAVLKIIVENERLVNECVPYYNIQCEFEGGVGLGTSVQRFDTVDAAREALVEMKDCEVRVISSVTRRRKEHVSAFTTSTLQQVAFQKCGFSVETTMRLAQNLYENGLITYIRTTSSCLSNKALEKIKELGGGSSGGSANVGAHEAIRPTFKKLEIACANEQKLYDLIYHRTLRSCSSKEIKEEVIELGVGGLVFNVVKKKWSVDALGEITIASTRVKEKFAHVSLNEGTLIKLMEELGIGRPSTYCSTLERLYKQKYIEKQASVEKHWEWNLGRLREYSVTNRKYKVLVPTLLGKSIIEFFNKNFADIIDVNFTKSLENRLDEIENGGISSKIILQEFWIRFSKMLDSVPPLGESDTVGSEKKVCTFMYNIDGKKFQVRTTKYGPVIENVEEKQFISLNAYLKQSHKTLESLTKQDVMFLISFPKKCEDGIISYGRFGFYMTAPDKTTCTLSLEDVLPPVA